MSVRLWRLTLDSSPSLWEPRDGLAASPGGRCLPLCRTSIPCSQSGAHCGASHPGGKGPKQRDGVDPSAVEIRKPSEGATPWGPSRLLYILEGYQASKAGGAGLGEQKRFPVGPTGLFLPQQRLRGSQGCVVTSADRAGGHDSHRCQRLAPGRWRPGGLLSTSLCMRLTVSGRDAPSPVRTAEVEGCCLRMANSIHLSIFVPVISTGTIYLWSIIYLSIYHLSIQPSTRLHL